MTRALLELLTPKHGAIEVYTSVILNDRLYNKNVSKLLSSYDHTILCLYILQHKLVWHENNTRIITSYVCLQYQFCFFAKETRVVILFAGSCLYIKRYTEWSISGSKEKRWPSARSPLLGQAANCDLWICVRLGEKKKRNPLQNSTDMHRIFCYFGHRQALSLKIKAVTRQWVMDVRGLEL